MRIYKGLQSLGYTQIETVIDKLDEYTIFINSVKEIENFLTDISVAK